MKITCGDGSAKIGRLTDCFVHFSQYFKSDIDITVCKSSKINADMAKLLKSDTQIKFGTIFTDHMLKISYDKHAGGWQKPYITPMEHLNLHPAAKVLHYATEV